MPAEMFYDSDADLSVIQGRSVAIIGYGIPGPRARAVAARLRRRRPRRTAAGARNGRAKAEAEGLRVVSVADAAAEADLIMILAPDQYQRTIYAEEIAPNLQDGDALFFAHGFNIRFGYIEAPAGVDVLHGRPEGPGSPGAPRVRRGPWRPGDRGRREGRVRRGLGAGAVATRRRSAVCGPAASRPPSPRRPRPTCSASRPCSAAARSALVQAGFEVLTEAGYQPEVAYFECLHELKLIVDLMYEGGIAKQRWSVSDTAEYGDYVSGPRVIDAT